MGAEGANPEQPPWHIFPDTTTARASPTHRLATLEEVLVTLRAERDQKDPAPRGTEFQAVLSHTGKFSGNCSLHSKG